jgi:hypothetical protein
LRDLGIDRHAVPLVRAVVPNSLVQRRGMRCTIAALGWSLLPPAGRPLRPLRRPGDEDGAVDREEPEETL